MDYIKLFESLKELKGIQDIWHKVLDMLKETDKLGDQSLIVLCIYFSLIDDGNICIPLNPDMLYDRWEKKWDNLLISNRKQLNNPLSKNDIEEAIKEIENDLQNCNLFKVESIDGIEWLYSVKYLNAKKTIESNIEKLFKNKRSNFSYENNSIEIENIDEYQQKAVVEGLKKNLVITGGPGTGKTTVAYHIIKNILSRLEEEKEVLNNWSLYFAAPSGKAADRMKESIFEVLDKDERIKKGSAVCKKIESIEPSTIHRLLKFRPDINAFAYNGNNKLPEKSIFIIDEVSMIDVCLFASLLDAISENSIVFLLGDKNQLPPVDAGAILGDIISQVENIVELKISHRTNEIIGKAAESVNSGNVPDDINWLTNLGDFNTALCNINKASELAVVRLIELDSIINSWISNSFDSENFTKCENLDYETSITNDFDNLFSSLVDKSKILCAERNGYSGSININRLVESAIFKNDASRTYHPGQVLMITKNLPLLDLYNGDNGIVVKFSQSETLWFTVKKSSGDDTEFKDGNILRKNGFVFYPLEEIPTDSIETSYAITIHKSQGSGYGNVLIFLPQRDKHPLLNRQILYTAITRSKGSVFVVSSRESLKQAVENVITRDTNIKLKF